MQTYIAQEQDQDQYKEKWRSKLVLTPTLELTAPWPVLSVGADLGFSWGGGGGRKRLCARSPYTTGAHAGSTEALVD